MKRITIIGCMLGIMSGVVFAQSPYIFNYQALARDGQGDPLVNKEVSVLISIISGFEDGPIEFQEEHVVSTNNHGIFNLAIGDGNFLIGNLRNLDWGSDQFFIRTEIDPSGGENYIDLGAAQLFSVPFALYALESGSASGGSEDDQQLLLDGNDLSIENGNTISLESLIDDADADPNNEIQQLSLSGSTLTLSGGNSVNLETLPGDADSDPSNELQSLSLENNMLSLSGSNSVTLDNTGSPWEVQDIGVAYKGFFANLQNDDGSNAVSLTRSNEGSGAIDVFGDSGKKIEMRSTDMDAGFTRLNGVNGELNVMLTSLGSDPNKGWVGAYNENGDDRAAMFAGSSGRGGVHTRGPNDKLNINLSALSANLNHGFIAVSDTSGTSQAGIYVDENGNGRVFADFVDAFVDNPDNTRSNQNQKMIYSMLQGPEAAAYLRGTAQLEDGTTKVDFPAHFSNLIAAEEITVMITPLSAKSKGIAVIQKSILGFEVKELFDGQGNYQFDWEVKGVRKKNLYYKKAPTKIQDLIATEKQN